MNFRLFSAALIFIVFGAGAAEPQTAPTLSLGESVRQGLNFSLEVKKAESVKAQAQDEFRLARSKLFPTVTLNASGGSAKTGENYGGTYSGAYKARLDAEQPLYTGGVVSAGLSAARLNRQVAEANAASIRQDYVFSIVNAYYNTAQAQVVLSIAKDNRTVLKSYLDITTKYAAIGRSKNIDRLEAEASYNLSEAAILDAESAYEQYRQDLIRLIGEERSSPVDEKLNLAPYDPESADKLLRRALDDNPAVKSLSLQLESLKEQNKVKMIDHRPKLSLKGSWGFDSMSQGAWFREPSEAYLFTVNLTVPLFSGLSSLAQSDQFFEQTVQLEKDLMIKQKALQKTLASALATMQRDFQRLKLTQSSAASSKKAMDVAVHDYRNGLLSSTDVLTIQRTKFDADRQYVSAQYSYNLQKLTLRYTLGEDLEKIYQSR